MRVNETSAQKRIWALVLTVMMVIGLLPFNVVAADEVVTVEEPAEGQGSALYGKVTALTGEEYNIVGEVDIEGNETESVTVTMTKMKLKCVLEDAAIGRPVDGWWAGIRVDAPDGITDEMVGVAKYKANGGEFQSFLESQDGENGNYWIGMWNLVNEEKLNACRADGTNLTTTYEFDWNGDKAIDQTITVEIVPAYIVLLDEEGENPVYPNYCSVCGEDGVVGAYLYTIDATCVDDGFKIYECDHTVSGEESGSEPVACDGFIVVRIPATGKHTRGDTRYGITKPTCTESGLDEYYLCEVCGCYLDGQGNVKDVQVFPPLGHEYKGVETSPTCTEDGIKTYTCSACSETKTETITATGHKWNDGEITTPATCEKDGEKTFTCLVCKETKTETIEKLGHAFGEVEVIKAPTCTETGISGKRCQHENCEVIDSETVLPATGHQWDEGVVTREPTYTEDGEKTFTCAVCQATRTETIPVLTPEPDSVDLNEIAKDFDGSSIGVDVDGKTLYPDGEGNYPRLTVPEGTTTLISVSTYNLPAGVDPHTRYPVSMAVYKATNTDGTTSVERISEMDALLRYAGSSIRITGNKGIRLITGINASLKSALTSEGVAGYTLEEYGTLLCWASEVQNGSLSLSDAYARHNYAYSLANGTDPVFRYAGDVVQYTNVLVGFSNEQCVDDIAMRPYITLRDADGNTYTLYGGIVNRSIGYIAYQNRGAFTPGTNAYNYIWDIIHFVYGDAYDEDYKG